MFTPGIGPLLSETVPDTVVCAFTAAENTSIRIRYPKFLKYFDLPFVIKKLQKSIMDCGCNAFNSLMFAKNLSCAACCFCFLFIIKFKFKTILYEKFTTESPKQKVKFKS